VLRLPGFSLDDLPPDAPAHEATEAHQSRLGRGLDAIMPGGAPQQPRARTGGLASVIPLGPDLPAPVEAAPAALSRRARLLVERLHGDLVVALLDGLASAVVCDLAAYVHQPDRGAPVLHLGRPEMSDLTPAQMFDLSRSLDALGRSRPGVVEPLAAGGFDGVAVVVAGSGARGLWVCARRGRALAAPDAAAAFARSTGAAATLLDYGRSGGPSAPPLVSLRVGEGQVQAHVQVAGASGTVGAPTGVEAAARAALAASGADAEFLYAAASRDEPEAASVVLVRNDGRVGVGCAAGAHDAPVLTATAALRAAGLEPASA
jgi:hypothetical protein